MIKTIRQEDVSGYKEVFVIAFYDGYIDGKKYDVESLNTEYMSFVASYGTAYYRIGHEAQKVCDKLNLKQLNSVKDRKG